jgi:hypothetical protein
MKVSKIVVPVGVALLIAALCAAAVAQDHATAQEVVTIFIVVWANLFFATSWFFSRPDALRRSLPITGAERRRTNKHFYEWLRSQGRR